MLKAAAGQARISASEDAFPDMPSAAQAPTLTANTALFLDFDGTLVDLAAQPDLVVVPQGLTSLLAQEYQTGHQHLLVSARRRRPCQHHRARPPGPLEAVGVFKAFMPWQ